MANTKISALTAATALDGTEALPVVQGVSTVKALVSAIRTYILGLSNTFTGKVTVNTASGAIMDLQTAGTSKFAVDEFGNVAMAAANLEVGVGTRLGVGGVTTYDAGSVGWSSTGAFSGAVDLSLFRDAAGTLAQRNGTNAQTFRVYNTYTDAANYERGKVGWNANVFEIGDEKAGTGSFRTTKLFSTSGGNITVGSNIQLNTGSGTGTVLVAALNINPNVNGFTDLGLNTLGFKRAYFDYTNTATVGAVTINKAAGRVNIAAAGTSVVVTNSYCTAAAHVFAVVSTADATAYVRNVVPAAGSFTITLGAAATAQTSIDFFIVNAD